MGQKTPEACSCDVRGVKMVFGGQEGGLLTFPSQNASSPSPKTGEVVEWREKLNR